jgi:hypothetical protein
MSHTQSLQPCIDVCTECHNICLEMVSHCLDKGGKHADSSHIRTLIDCADICRTSADFMLRGSDLHASTCGACSEVCLQCAESCDQFDTDAEMKRCAEVCRRCAESCEQMAGKKAD